jgi:glutathione S-transferase
MAVKLYYSPGACSLAAHIVLEELGEPYSLERVSIPDGKTRSADFLAINPKGKVPVLSIDGLILTELPAILLFLARSQPEKKLIPPSAIGQSQCMEWLSWLVGSVHATSIAQIWNPQRFIDLPEQFAKVSAVGKKNLIDAYCSIETRLTGKEWILEDRFSVVDPFLLVFYRWGNRVGIDMRNQYPEWFHHTERMLSRPAVSRVVNREDIRAQIHQYLEQGFNPHPVIPAAPL